MEREARGEEGGEDEGDDVGDELGRTPTGQRGSSLCGTCTGAETVYLIGSSFTDERGIGSLVFMGGGGAGRVARRVVRGTLRSGILVRLGILPVLCLLRDGVARRDDAGG